ncbi:glutathione S-transferase T3-like protein [Tanacetum coccineum]
MSKQNTPQNANRQQRRIIRGSPPTPDGTFDLRNTSSATQEPQRINFVPPQLVYPNQPYYHKAYNNPLFAPPQQQSAFNPYGQPNIYGHYDYGSHHNVGGSSSQPNFSGSSSQPNVGGSSSQPSVRGSLSPVRKFSLEDEDFTNLYSPSWTELIREEQSLVEEIEEIQVPEETALCKGWVRTSEDSVKGNMRKERGFWIDILKYMHDTCPITQRRTYDMVNEKWKTVRSKVYTFCGVYANAVQMYTSGASDTDYLQRALIGYQAEYGVPFTLLHCWEVLKDSEKWNSGELLAFRQEKEDGKNKNENEVEEVEEVRRPRPMGRDQAKRKMKASSTSSASSFDVAELAKMMANEYVMASDSYNIQKKQEMSQLLKIKNRELELKAAELEIRRMENRQRDELLYETTTDEALKERLRQRLFG